MKNKTLISTVTIGKKKKLQGNFRSFCGVFLVRSCKFLVVCRFFLEKCFAVEMRNANHLKMKLVGFPVSGKQRLWKWKFLHLILMLPLMVIPR